MRVAVKANSLQSWAILTWSIVSSVALQSTSPETSKHNQALNKPSKGEQTMSENITTPVAPVKKKKGKLKWFLLFLIILAAIGYASKGGSSTTSNVASDDLHEVVYEVTGTASSVSITYQNESGGTAQQDSIGLPMTNKAGQSGMHFKMDDGAFMYISAQNEGSTGSVTCTIKVDGKTVKTTTSQGAYVIATCSDYLW